MSCNACVFRSQLLEGKTETRVRADSVEKAKLYYNICMNTSATDAAGAAPLYEVTSSTNTD